jgi:hypothetical protein
MCGEDDLPERLVAITLAGFSVPGIVIERILPSAF